MKIVLYLGEKELLPILYHAILLPRNKIVKVNIFIMTMLAMIFSLSQLFFLIRAFNMKHFLRNAPQCFMGFFIVVTMSMYMGSYNIYGPYVKFYKNHFFWDLSTTSGRVRRKIFENCRTDQIMYIMEVILMEIATLLNISIWTRDYTKFSLASNYITEHFPECATIIHYYCFFLCFVMIFFMTSSKWFIHYMLLYLKFQIFMLTEQLIGINKRTKRTNLMSEENSQDTLNQNLKSFFKRHGEILEFLTFLKVRGKYLNFSFAFASFLTSLYTVFVIYSEFYGLTLKIVTFGGFAFILTTTAYQCQLFEDGSEQLKEQFCNLNWYTWNKENLKLYTVGHVYVVNRTMTVPMPSFIPANMNLVKMYSKFWYSAANFFHTMKRS